MQTSTVPNTLASLVEQQTQDKIRPIPPLQPRDYLGSLKVRLGLGRMHYTVEPGLYSHGTPSKDSPVLVTANYKLSFDTVRRAIKGFDLWLLVLDTKGINVWCAAGKNSFGTAELANRIEACTLGALVSHRTLIVPQLGAPGVAAHRVKQLTGFNVVFGPIQANDIPAFLNNSQQATPEMRRKTFSLIERAVLIPLELFTSAKLLVGLVLTLACTAAATGPSPFFSGFYNVLPVSLTIGLIGIGSGTIITPLLLPYLPARSFALKGFFAGLLGAPLFFALFPFHSGPLVIRDISALLIICSLSAYGGMIFTGASTYTSLSGVKKEMQTALPLEISGGILGLVGWTIAGFLT